MSASWPQVVFDAERMKYPHTGLYHFCWELGKALQEKFAPQPHHLQFYLPDKLPHFAGPGFGVMQQHWWHKFFLPVRPAKAIWHAAHQGTDYLPFSRQHPLVLTVHDLNFLYDPDKSASRQKAYLTALAQKIKRADRVVAISAFTAAEIQNRLDTGGKPIDVIYNGCADTSRVQATRPHRVPTAPFLFTIGTVATKKNFHILPALLTDNDLHLVIAGIHQQPAYARKIMNEARALGVSNRVHLTGPITAGDKKWYYEQALACVFPSLAEGFGLPVVEALQSGKPLLLSRHGALPEIGGDLAHYFYTEDPAHLRQQLRLVLQDQDLARKAARQARAASFSWHQAAEAYFCLYQGLQ